MAISCVDTFYQRTYIQYANDSEIFAGDTEAQIEPATSTSKFMYKSLNSAVKEIQTTSKLQIKWVMTRFVIPALC